MRVVANLHGLPGVAAVARQGGAHVGGQIRPNLANSKQPFLAAGTPPSTVEYVGARRGLEGWRQLHLQLAAGGPTRAMGLLLKIMEAKFSSEAEVIDQLNAWEALVRLHDQEAEVGAEVPDKINQAVILRAALHG